MSNEAEKRDEGKTSYKLYSKTTYGSEEHRMIGVDLANGKDFTSYGRIQANLYSNEKGND